MQEDPYTLLGVRRGATPNEIRRAYRERVVSGHRTRVLDIVEHLAALQHAYRTLLGPLSSSPAPRLLRETREAREGRLLRHVARARGHESMMGSRRALETNAQLVAELVREHDERQARDSLARARRALASRLVGIALLALVAIAVALVGMRFR